MVLTRLPVSETTTTPSQDLPFNPAEWKTSTPSPSPANPRAPKGGMLRLSFGGGESFPPTVRTEGPNSRLATLSDIQGLIYENLITFDLALGDFVPALASHWQIGKDNKTFRFRINPKARWSNGQPVTADDVKASFEHYTNPDRKDPSVTDHWKEVVDDVRILDRVTSQVIAKSAGARHRDRRSLHPAATCAWTAKPTSGLELKLRPA